MTQDDDQMQFLKQFHEMPKGTGWADIQKPVLILDGHAQSWKPGDAFSAKNSLIVGMNDKNFAGVCRSLTAESVYFYDMRVTDISAIADITGLRQITLHWNSKLSNPSPLASLTQLEALALVDTPKVTDLGFVSTLSNLRAFAFSGASSLSNKNTAQTLTPLGDLQNLEELRLQSVNVQKDGLRPLANCTQLK